MGLIAIDDPRDPRIEPYLDIRERDLTGRRGRFIIEGEVVLRVALRLSHFALESVLIAENRAAPLAGLLGEMAPDLPVYCARRAVLDRIAGFPLHRGILAIGVRGEAESPDALVARLPPLALVVVLSGIANHDNMGGLFRNAAAFGAAAVLLDAACCDPLYRKAIRVSAGAALLTPFARGSSVEALCDALVRNGFAVFATSPRGRERLEEVQPAPRMAAVFGAEGHGLAPEFLARTRTLRIDMAGGFSSLNVATTSGIVLHHLRAGVLAARPGQTGTSIAFS
jgi:tRNA G18 (ribose-2'-O)-methylase SpoU